MIYDDPTGHWIHIAIGAGIGVVADFAGSALNQKISTGKVSLKQSAKDTALGALSFLGGSAAGKLAKKSQIIQSATKKVDSITSSLKNKASKIASETASKVNKAFISATEKMGAAIENKVNKVATGLNNISNNLKTFGGLQLSCAGGIGTLPNKVESNSTVGKNLMDGIKSYGNRVKDTVKNAIGGNDGITQVTEKTTRVRHYTNRKGINGIEQDGKIIARDNNRVYVEPANKKPLSQIEAERKYQIKKGKGRDYVEFDVPNSMLEWVKNPRYGTEELTIKGGVEELINPIFKRRK